MKILIDVFGSDHPEELIAGCARCSLEVPEATLVLLGREEVLRPALEALPHDPARIELMPAATVITNHDDPIQAVMKQRDSSLVAGIQRLRRDEEIGGMITAGSTGALLTGATLIVKRIHGIRRAALAPVLPNGDAGVMLIDCGANADCTPEYLLQFAYMGSYYARTMLGIAAPRVGLLSNGTEDHKGAELQHETFPLLKAADAAGRIRFIGNVEASQVFNGDVDVVVTDGFTGNVLLKGIEGSIKYMTRQLKGIFMKNFKTKMAALAIKNEFKALKASLDPNEVGGTAMLGISKPVIKAHGSSDARAIYNAIRQAISFVDSGIIDDITANISYMRVDKHAEKELS